MEGAVAHPEGAGIDGAAEPGLVHRVRTDDDRRVVRLALTADGARRLERLSAQHLEEIKRRAPLRRGLTKGLGVS